MRRDCESFNFVSPVASSSKYGYQAGSKLQWYLEQENYTAVARLYLGIFTVLDSENGSFQLTFKDF